MRLTPLLGALLTGLLVRADIQAGHPDPAPPGYEQWISPIVPAPYVDGAGDWAEAVAKARKLVAGLTIQEKVNITTGIGINARCMGNTGAITRLKFPGLCLHDGPLGLRFADRVSAFPAGITAASTWDHDLILSRAKALGEEFRGKGVNVALGPATNLARVAAGGRNWEAWSADPYLSGVATALTVKGIQGQGVIACAKHYIANEQEQFRGGSLSETYSSNVDDRTLHEVYAWPFMDALHAGAGSVMASYNRLNQTVAGENSKVLNGILKTEMNFQGFVTSDWTSLVSGVNSALGGTDMNMPGFKSYGNPPDLPNPAESDNTFWGKFLVEAVVNGSVAAERLDDMVIRPFAAYYKMQQDSKSFPKLNFDVITSAAKRPGSDVVTNEFVNVQADHKNIIRKVAAAGTVLLKNEKKALPLKLGKGAGAVERLGVFGSDAGPHPAGPNFCTTGLPDRACNEGTLAMGWGSGTANFPYLIDPLAAISTYVSDSGSGATVDSSLSDWNFANIDKVGAYADACLVFSSADSGEGYLTVDGNPGDRKNLTLWNNGDNLIKYTASVCDNTIVVIHSVGPVLVEDWISHPNVTAVVWANLPGQESGNSLVDVLFGKVNPSGRLPYTIAKRREDYGADVVYQSDGNVQLTYTDALNIDYRHFDAKAIVPRFEFGFGLSYTTFAYSGLQVSKSIAKRQEVTAARKIPQGGDPSLWKTSLTVSFTVKNTGSLPGHEVSQVYLGFPAAAGEPPKVLRGFKRTYLKNGASAKVIIELTRRDLSVWDVVKQDWVVPGGKFEVFVGASSRDVKLVGTFST